MPMPRPRISVSVTMHVNSGVRTLNPASLPNPIYGVWRTQVWRHSMASSLSELQQHFLKRKVWRLIPIGWWSTADRPCLLGQTIKAQHAFAMAADGDHYILTFNAPVNVEDVYVRIEFHLPADARQGLHRCPRPDTRTNWHLYPYNVICRLHARVQRYASRLNKMTWGSVRGLGVYG